MLSLRNVFIVVWLAVQILLPLRPLFKTRQDTRGHFSWNMYSQRYRCAARWDLIQPSGVANEIEYRKHFNRRSRASMIYYRDILPGFNRYLCDYYRERDLLTSIRASVSCSWNGGADVELIEPGVDVCIASNYGVIAP